MTPGCGLAPPPPGNGKLGVHGVVRTLHVFSLHLLCLFQEHSPGEPPRMAGSKLKN